MSKPQFIFLGGLYPPKMLSTIVHDTRGKVGFSNHNFEQKLIDGLCHHTEDINLHIISAPKCYSYPTNNCHPWVKAEQWTQAVGVQTRSVGFCNIVGINKLTIPLSVYKELCRIVDGGELSQFVYIIVNTPSANLLHAVDWLKKSYPNRIKVALIVPDIPTVLTGMDSHHFLMKWLLDFIDRRNIALYDVVDKFVLLTEQMKELIPVGGKPYIVMEGLCNLQKDLPSSVPSINNKISILYTGTLRHLFGIIDLLDAFAMLPMDNIELWLCGSGDAESEIRERANRDFRIKFWGLLNAEHAEQLQRQADILVNPRTNEGEYTKYSFPSKTMEYLLAGKPIVMHRLDGIPKEYDPFLVYAANDSVGALADALTHVITLSKEERATLGEQGRKFVLDNKNNRVQTGKIISLLLES